MAGRRNGPRFPYRSARSLDVDDRGVDTAVFPPGRHAHSVRASTAIKNNDGLRKEHQRRHLGSSGEGPAGRRQ